MAIPLFQRVIKVGTSLAVVLPVQITRGLGIQRGDFVALSATQVDRIVIKLFTHYEVDHLRMSLPGIES